jgi:membrane protein DedA with SNARE-associated domain
MVKTAEGLKVLRARVSAPTLGAAIGLVIGTILGAQIGGIGIALMGTAFGIPGIFVILAGAWWGCSLGHRIGRWSARPRLARPAAARPQPHSR